MPVTDPVSDMLTRIRNAIMVRQDVVIIPASKIKNSIAEILKEEGFIEGYDLVKPGTIQAAIRVRLHYRGRNDPAISGLKRISKPGLRVYVQRQEIPRPFGGLGISIISTSQGVLTGRQAYRNGIGGEVLCYVW